jgi:hypothetical protein
MQVHLTPGVPEHPMLKRIGQLVFWMAIGIGMAGCAAHSSRMAVSPPQAPVATPDTFTVPDPAFPSHITLAWDDPHNADRGARGYYLYYWQVGWDERIRSMRARRPPTRCKTSKRDSSIPLPSRYTMAQAGGKVCCRMRLATRFPRQITLSTAIDPASQ